MTRRTSIFMSDDQHDLLWQIWLDIWLLVDFVIHGCILIRDEKTRVMVGVGREEETPRDALDDMSRVTVTAPRRVTRLYYVHRV